jgi:hypothetical protein
MANSIGTHDVSGERIEIHVHSDGIFQATFSEEEYNAKTLEELKAKLEKAVKAARNEKAVPCTVLGFRPVEKRKGSAGFSDEPFEAGLGFVQAKLRGKHARQHETYLLMTDDGKQRFQLNGWRSSNGVTLTERLGEAEIAQYLELAKIAEAAQAELNAFLEARKVRPEELLKDAKR